MKKVLLVATAITAFTFAACSGASAAGDNNNNSSSNNNTCLSEENLAAFNTRVLQTELMESALSCNEHKSHYNEFVKKYKNQLIQESDVLRAYFKKTYGPLADTEMNHFITKLANDTSEVNFGKQQHGFCTYTGDKFDRLKAVRPEDFAKFAAAEKSEVVYKAPGCK